MDVHYALKNLELLNSLKQYLMYIEDNLERSSQGFQLIFMTPHLLKSECDLTTGKGPILSIKNDHEINCSKILRVYQKSATTCFPRPRSIL